MSKGASDGSFSSEVSLSPTCYKETGLLAWFSLASVLMWIFVQLWMMAKREKPLKRSVLSLHNYLLPFIDCKCN